MMCHISNVELKKKLLGRYSHPSVQIKVQNKSTNSSFTSLSYTANMEYDASYLKFWTIIIIIIIIKIILKINKFKKWKNEKVKKWKK